MVASGFSVIHPLFVVSSILSSTFHVDARPFSIPTCVVASIRGGSSSDPNYGYIPTNTPDTDAPPSAMLHQETFQDKIDAWKARQQEQYAPGLPLQSGVEVPEYSVRDAEGRVKLITSVSKGSRALIFFLLLWRDVHLYEVADSTLKGFLRLAVVTPLCVLFLANLAGVVASLTSPSHSSKKRLKAILNLDKLVESVLILYNFFRLTVWPNKLTPRETYIANTLHSVFFLLQSQAFTRVTWDQIGNPYVPQSFPPATENPSYEYSPNNINYQGNGEW